jgi:predicted Co/Zn/Cd cation transporter (cation efflux family)
MSGRAGTAYLAVIQDQLQKERDRRKAFEERAITVITTSGTLVTLMFGLAAVVTSATSFSLPDTARNILSVAVVGFLLAIVAALFANVPLNYMEPTAQGMLDLTEETAWSADERIGERAVARLYTKMIDRARRMNMVKVRLLVVALIFEVLAGLIVAVAVIYTLLEA